MKIVIAGEAFEYDNTRRPLSEALAIEKEWGRRYAEWEQELLAGSAEATAVLVWVVYRREGRDVPLGDILDGTVDFDYSELIQSLGAAYLEAQAEAAAADPTSGGGPLTVPDGTGTTPAATSGRSRRSSASPPGTSGS